MSKKPSLRNSTSLFKLNKEREEQQRKNKKKSDEEQRKKAKKGEVIQRVKDHE